jgi:FKBP-type peptidyl-prolyl cis-trans isomerase 2
VSCFLFVGRYKEVLKMDSVKEGDKVELICEFKLEDGTIFFKNEQEKPFVFIVGEGKFFPAIEKKLKDMKEGETKTINLEPKDAFGVYNKDLVADIPKNNISNDGKLSVGSSVKMKTDSDKMIQGSVTGIKDDSITVDFNHPLVNKNITAIVTILSIEKN